MQTKQKIKQNKVLMTICLDKELLKQFKKVAQKDLRKYSNIVEGSIRRYVPVSYTHLTLPTKRIV